MPKFKKDGDFMVSDQYINPADAWKEGYLHASKRFSEAKLKDSAKIRKLKHKNKKLKSENKALKQELANIKTYQNLNAKI